MKFTKKHCGDDWNRLKFGVAKFVRTWYQQQTLQEYVLLYPSDRKDRAVLGILEVCV